MIPITIDGQTASAPREMSWLSEIFPVSNKPLTPYHVLRRVGLVSYEEFIGDDRLIEIHPHDEFFVKRVNP